MWPLSSTDQSLNYLGLTGIGLKQNPIERKIKRIEKKCLIEVNGHAKREMANGVFTKRNSFTNFGTYRDTYFSQKCNFIRIPGSFFAQNLKRKKSVLLVFTSKIETISRLQSASAHCLSN